MSGKCESFSFGINHHEYIISTTPSFSPTFLQRRDASCLKDQNILFLVFEYFSNSSLFEIGKSEASDRLMVWNSVKYDTIHSMLCEVEQHNFKRLPNQAEYKFSSNHPIWYWRDLGRLMLQSLLSISMFIGNTPNWI